jgi:membrane associated rhomboid family serine protease
VIPLRDKNASGTVPVVVMGLIILNVLVWFFELSLGPTLENFLLHYGVVPKNVVSFSGLSGGGFSNAIVPVFSSMFIHVGWAHILFNMWFLWIFGDNVEDHMGHFRFLIFYLLCGIGAALAHVVVHPQSQFPMVGASGAVSGVLGAYALSFPKAHITTFIGIWPFEVHAFAFLIFWFVIQLLPGLLELGDSRNEVAVAYWAHVGGFVIGMGLVWIFPKRAGFLDRSDLE